MTAFLPLLAALAAVFLVSAAGFTERSLVGTALEDYFYGYFFREYPLFLFAMVYGAARIVAAAAEPGARRGLRAFSTPLAIALFLATGFYPTFGGFIARPGFAVGGMIFLQGNAAWVALVLGAGAAAIVYGLALGLCVAFARLRVAVEWRPLAGAAARFLALWAGAVILVAVQAGTDLLGGWPILPLPAWSAFRAGGWLVLALLPHAAAVAWTRPSAKS